MSKAKIVKKTDDLQQNRSVEKTVCRKEVILEKVYKTMKSVGAFNIVMGILMIISGIAFGVVIIAKGAKLLKRKSELTF
ncbi:MAG: hypothetical protein SO170_10760 [Butyribacter sp.]|nr:hypothetical protein [bacterium]MDY3855415.1 hypothetical protein [Butyribacter sp.]